MESIFVINNRLLGITVLFFAVFLVLFSVSAKPIHASIVGGSGGKSGSYWECTNVPINGANCNSNIPVTDGSVGLKVTVYDVSNGTQSLYSSVGVSIRSSPPNGFGGDSTSNGGWGPYWNYWFQGSGCSSRCWDFANGGYSLNNGEANSYQYPNFPRPGGQNGPGAAPSEFYSSSGNTNNNGVYYLSPNGYLDCGFSPFTLNIYSPARYKYMTINGYNENSMSGLNFSNGGTYNFVVKIYTTGGSGPGPGPGPGPTPNSCSISVTPSSSNPNVGDTVTLNVTYRYNGAPSSSTLGISANPGPASQNSVRVINGNGTATENDPAGPPPPTISETYTVSNSNPPCSSSTTVTWEPLLCTSPNIPGCEYPIQPVCNPTNQNAGSYGGVNGTIPRNYKQLVINGSVIGYNGIYDYRDLGGCDPFYPSVKILYNLKYISLYNVNFLKLIGNNLEVWQEEGI